MSSTRRTDQKKEKKDGESSWKDTGWFALKTAAISGAVLGGAVMALPAISFTVGGVAVGSLMTVSYESAVLGCCFCTAAAVPACIIGSRARINKDKSVKSLEVVINNEENDPEVGAGSKNDGIEKQVETNKSCGFHYNVARSMKNDDPDNDKNSPAKFVSRKDDDDIFFQLNHRTPRKDYEEESKNAGKC